MCDDIGVAMVTNMANMVTNMVTNIRQLQLQDNYKRASRSGTRPVLVKFWNTSIIVFISPL